LLSCRYIVCVICNMAAVTWCLCCRYPGLGPGGPPQGAALHQFGLFPTPTGPSQAALGQLERERFERLGEHRCHLYRLGSLSFLVTGVLFPFKYHSTQYSHISFVGVLLCDLAGKYQNFSGSSIELLTSCVPGYKVSWPRALWLFLFRGLLF
jgi:hypothetical protein